MKIFLSKTAFTLMELIISLTLVSVIFLGIVSINVVLNNNNQDYGQRYFVKSATQITMNQILNNASLAVGSATRVGPVAGVIDKGILTTAADGLTTANEFCIHQQPASGDTWLCYIFDDTVGDAAYKEITYCKKKYKLTDATGFRGANGACTPAAQFLGTAFSMVPTPTFTNSNGQLLFSVTIQNCLNDTATSTEVCGTDPVNNPEVTLTGSSTPQLESI